MDGGLMRAAQQCLDVLPARWQDDPAVQHERQLIDAAHLTWTLQQSGSSIFNRGRGADSGVLPIEIRLAADLYELIKCILDRQPQGYKKPRIVKEIANKLRGVNESKGLRNLGVGSVSDAFVTGLLLDAATAQRDYSAAYEFARQLGNARTVLDQALKAVEAYRSAQLLHEARVGIERPVEVRAVEQAWTACVRLADAWGDSSGVGEKRLEVISLALSLCPTGKIPELLKLWNQVQTDVLDSRADVLLPWVESASAEASILDVMVGSQHEVAEDQGQRSVAGESVDFESMRTFDPAIIKSSLRQASDSHTRCGLLMEWLEFAMTTAKEPKTDKAAAYKARVEAEIVQKHTAKACKVLADKVVLQLDQTNYFAMETFYAFLARCLERNGDSEGAEQAGVRSELARGIRRC
ncbi:hypothetical protein DL89DRAFT_98416 [Linderina pennispora]|uniref:Sec39 domain-containing protein n=1 Tax=Linderina pennispora TaxID=61395 RepID=A0A1Y1VWL5_9FUNG|nr:uncharacterized protein DL89DRAFT_98416 [Linderina pennispora]ORX65681.1 hypothetical protein DL89DRAFT_98416 [Linderina pennispora]